MNYRGQSKRKDLPHCRVCGMDAGIRMVTEEAYEQHYVECQVCGYKTRKYSTPGAATAEWCGTNRKVGR